MSSDLAVVQERAAAIERAFAKMGLAFSPGSLEIMTNSFATESPWELAAGLVAWKCQITCLGVKIDKAASTKAAVDHRIRAASHLMRIHANDLATKPLPLDIRRQHFYRMLAPCVLCGAGGWTPSAVGRDLLRAFEKRCWRIMLALH